MFCRECRNVIPDKFLVCPACANKRSQRALWAFQFERLRMVYDGHQGALTTRAQQGRRHVQMFGADRTYCGKDVNAADRKGRIDPNLDDMGGICGDCRAELERALKEARTHE